MEGVFGYFKKQVISIRERAVAFLIYLNNKWSHTLDRSASTQNSLNTARRSKKEMKKGFTVVLIFLSVITANAQQIGMFGHSFYKPMVYNPAFTGVGDATSATLISRSQWTGFNSAPQLTFFIVDGNFNILNKNLNLGIGLINDRMGISSRTGGSLYYSYKLKLKEDMHVLFGVSLGILDQTMDFSKAVTETSSDPTVLTDSRHKIAVDANVGAAFFWKDVEAGIAIPQLIGSKLQFTDNTNARAYYTQARHYMGSVKFHYVASKEKEISVIPQALIRFVPGAPFQFDGTINVDWKSKFWVGATYKSGYAMAANVGLCLHNQLYIGYSYDFIVGNIANYAGMSQEIMAHFKFGKSSKSPAVATDTTPQIENTAATQVATQSVTSPANSSSPDEIAKLKNSIFQKEMKRLQTKLNNNQTVIIELNSELERQNQKVAAQSAAIAIKPPAIVPNIKGGIPENEGIFITKRADFKNEMNATADKGFYVIVGIFTYRDFAMEEVKNFAKRGFKNGGWLFSESKQTNYVFVEKLDSKEEALEKVKSATTAGGSNVWVLKLID